MGANKKVASKAWPWTTKKKVVTFGGILVGIVIIMFMGLYFANKPNYRDLEREYKRISANIPSDWQLVNQSGNKGTWGLFCIQIEGEECPYSISNYTLGSFPSDSSSVYINLRSILESFGYQLVDDSYGQKCSNTDINNQDYVCFVKGYKNNFQLIISNKSVHHGITLKMEPGASISIDKKP